MTETIFTKIVKGEIPSFKIYEDKDHYAFLDITPFTKGHTLVIPKKEYENVTDMPEEEYANLQKVVHKLMKHYREIFKIKVGSLIYGIDVPHVHIHIYPLSDELEVFELSKTKKYLDGEMKNYQKRLSL